MEHHALQKEARLRQSLGGSGRPLWDFEAWFLVGLECYRWRLTPLLIKQAFRAQVRRWQDAGKRIEMWQIRAFCIGRHGGDEPAPKFVTNSFVWPEPQDGRWEIVVCTYPDGLCDLDMVDVTSKRFWSDEHGHFHLPSYDRAVIDQNWFEEMGFTVLKMTEPVRARGFKQKALHLRLVCQK